MPTGNGHYREIANWLATVLIGAFTTFVACQHADQREAIKIQRETDERQGTAIRDAQDKVHEHTIKLESSLQEIEQLQISEKDVHRLEIRILRLEMKLDAFMRAEGVRQPRNLPHVPPLPQEEEAAP